MYNGRMDHGAYDRACRRCGQMLRAQKNETAAKVWKRNVCFGEKPETGVPAKRSFVGKGAAAERMSLAGGGLFIGGALVAALPDEFLRLLRKIRVSGCLKAEEHIR